MTDGRSRTEGGPSQYCRGAIERGLESHLCTTYTTLHYPKGRSFHFCDAHPPEAPVEVELEQLRQGRQQQLDRIVFLERRLEEEKGRLQATEQHIGRLETMVEQVTDCVRRGFHAWTWTRDEGPEQHCDDCGITRSSTDCRT